MVTIKLKVIPEPNKKQRTILRIKEGETVIARGDGQFTYTCGNCQTVLLEGMNQGQFENMVLKCNACQSFNDLP
jgi:hypothetical protein